MSEKKVITQRRKARNLTALSIKVTIVGIIVTLVAMIVTLVEMLK